MSITITATQAGSTKNGVLLRVRVYTAAAVSQSGAGKNSQTGAASHSCAVTPTQNGSLLLSVEENGSSGGGSAMANNTIIDQVSDTTNNQTYATYTTAATGSGGGAPVSGTAFTCGSPDSFNGSCAALEILPAVTGTAPSLDASSPAVADTLTATTITSAAFTPPAGSLLVALVSSDGSTGTVTMTVSGGGLTWTEVIKGNGAGEQYAGIWLAQVTAGATPAPLVVPSLAAIQAA